MKIISIGWGMRNIILFLSSISAVSVSFPAHAGWQYTEWGMSPNEVVAASKGRVQLNDGQPDEEIEGLKIRAVGTHQSGQFNFKSHFHFKGNQLSDVRMELLSSNLINDFHSLRHTLDGLYGKPFSASTGVMEIYTYHDQKNNNRIDLFSIGFFSVTLEYRPLRDVDSAGL